MEHAKEAIATATQRFAESGADGTLVFETGSIQRAAEQAQRAVEGARPRAGKPEVQDNRRPSGAFTGLSGRLSRLVERVTLVRGLSERARNAYLAFEHWYEGSRGELAEERRSPNAARDLSDALFYLVPSGPAFFAFLGGIAFALWLASSRFEVSIEALVVKPNLFGLTAFDQLFRFAVLSLCGISAWCVYRLATVWNSIRKILDEIEPDLSPSFEALPPKLARLTRLTPLGHTSRSEIEDEVEERWATSKRLFGSLQRAFTERVVDIAGTTLFDCPAAPRSVAFDLGDSGLTQFDAIARAVGFCRAERLLEPAGANAGVEDQRMHEWARAMANLYAVYVADYIDWLFQHLRYLATFLVVALALTVLLLSSYPFQPQSVMKAIYLIVLVLGVATLLFVVVSMNRHRVLSAIANTTAGTQVVASRIKIDIGREPVAPARSIVVAPVAVARDVLSAMRGLHAASQMLSTNG